MCGFSYLCYFLKSEKCFLFLWSLTTAHWTQPMVSNSLYFTIKCLYICKYKHIARNKYHLNLWSHHWLWLNSSICSKGRNKSITLSVREDGQTVALSWFTAHLFLSTSQHTNNSVTGLGFQRGNNVSWSLLNGYLFFQGQQSITVKTDIQETFL